MTEIKKAIPARLYNASQGGHVAGVEDIIDDELNKTQKEINTEVDTHLTTLDGQHENIDGRLSVVEEHEQVMVDGGTIGIATATDFTNRTTEGDAKVPTVAAVINGMGEGVWDVSAHNNGAIFTDLNALLTDANLSTLIPVDIRHGGMRIQFIQGTVQSSDNKYVQFRFMLSTFTTSQFTNTANWQGVDDEPTAGSENFVTSNGIASAAVFDVSEHNKSGDVPAVYDSIYSVMSPDGRKIPSSVRKRGMTIKFLIRIPATYTSVKTTSDSAPSGATELNAALTIGGGTYIATNIGNSVSLPSTIGNSVVYYHLNDGTYTIWTITKATDESSKYVYYRLTTENWTYDYTKWINCDASIINNQYYVCDTDSNTQYKCITAVGYDAFVGGSIKVKMLYKHTGSPAGLAINGSYSKALYYNGQRASSNNTWKNNEIIEIFYDGSVYQSYNVEGKIIDGIFDISSYNNKRYATFDAAIAEVPTSRREIGMTIRYIDSVTSKYVQCRLLSTSWSNSKSDWQGVDDEPTLGSSNLVESNGVDVKKEDKVNHTDNDIINSHLKEIVVVDSSYEEYYIEITNTNYVVLYGKNTETTELVNIALATITKDVVFPIGTKYGNEYNKIHAYVIFRSTGSGKNTGSQKLLYTTKEYNPIINDYLAGYELQKETEQKVPINSVNLYNEDLLIDGTMINASGNRQYAAGWIGLYGTMIIPWFDQTQITLNCAATGGFRYVQLSSLVPFYEMLQSTITSITSTQMTITKAEGAKYLAITINQGITNKIICYGDSLKPYEAYNPIAGYVNTALSEIKGSLSTVVTEKIGKNLLLSITWGKGINSSGTIVDADPIYGISNAIPLNGHTKIYNNSFPTSSGYTNNIYDENGVKLATVSGNVINTSSYPTASYVICTVATTANLYGRKQIEYGDVETKWYPASQIQGMQVEYYEITCNSDENSDADFTGNLAIRNAIASITDATYFKRYILRCKGEFTATKPSDYEIGPNNASLQYAMFWLKDFVYLEGTERSSFVLYASLPDTIAECQEDDAEFGTGYKLYSNYQPIFLATYPSNIKNATIICRNTRYCIHACNGDPQPLKDSTIVIENCTLIHEGKFGDSIGTIGGTPIGTGGVDGLTYRVVNCLIKGNGAIYTHDTDDQKKALNLIYEGCTVFNDNWMAGITIECKSVNVGVNIKVANIKKPEKFTLNYQGIYGNDSIDNEFADTMKINADFDFEAIPLMISGPSALRIVGANNNSTVRFDVTSSAFDVIVGDISQTVLQVTNKYNRHQQYGYQWRDGGGCFAGEAIGFRNISDDGKTLGIRLGDCSSANKVLGIIINDTTYTVTFNRDYTSVSNADIIAEINAVIGEVATASEYNVNADWYTSFKGLQWATVDDSGSIARGMGVVYTSSVYSSLGVRKATAADGRIDGIAIDSGVNGSDIRIVTEGCLNYEINPTHPLIDTNKHYYNVDYNAGFAIGETDGVFVESENNVVLRKKVGDGIAIVKQ